MLLLENILADTFPAIASPEVGDDALRSYTAQLKALDNLGRLTESHARDAIQYESAIDLRLGEVVREALDQPLRIGRQTIHAAGTAFQPGASVVVIDRHGNMSGVHHQPNQNPQLETYGNQLLWAALQAGRARHGTGKPLAKAYSDVSVALFDKQPKDIPFKNRHHLGGAMLDGRISPKGHLAKDGELMYSGVSGVLLAEGVRYITAHDSTLEVIAAHARAEEADEGFEGNIFIGSIDREIAGFVLGKLMHHPVEAGIDLMPIKEQFAAGINPH